MFNFRKALLLLAAWGLRATEGLCMAGELLASCRAHTLLSSLELQPLELGLFNTRSDFRLLLKGERSRSFWKERNLARYFVFVR